MTFSLCLFLSPTERKLAIAVPRLDAEARDSLTKPRQNKMKREKDHTPSFTPVKGSNLGNVAVAIQANESDPEGPARIVAAGRGKIAQEIIDIAYTHNILVREDCALAELLAQLELDTPIPSEAIIAVAEILAKVYEANNAMAFPSSTLELKGNS